MQAPKLPRSELFTSLEEPTCDLGGGMASGREGCQKSKCGALGVLIMYIYLLPANTYVVSKLHFN